MSPKYYLSLFCFIAGISNANADLLRVNNQLATDENRKIFESIEKAHEFAQSGDTLLLEGSTLPYAGLNIMKRLVLIGTGYFLAENPETQADQLSSQIWSSINFNEGSEGSFLIGLKFTKIQGSPNYDVLVGANDITIMRCYFSSGVLLMGNPPSSINKRSIKNVRIIQNYFDTDARMGLFYNREAFSDVFFNNNIVRGRLITGSEDDRVFSQVNHNVFANDSPDFLHIRAVFFRNNIIASGSSLLVHSNRIQNNLMQGSQLKGDNNQSYTATDLFVGSEGNSPDGQFQLKQDSPHLTAGFEGAEPGVFGGDTPYVLSGIPPIPTIYEFSASSFANQDTGLSIQLKAKTNN